MMPQLKAGRRYAITEENGFLRLDNTAWQRQLADGDKPEEWQALPPKPATIIVREVVDDDLLVVADVEQPRRRRMLPTEYILTAEEIKA